MGVLVLLLAVLRRMESKVSRSAMAPSMKNTPGSSSDLEDLLALARLLAVVVTGKSCGAEIWWDLLDLGAGGEDLLATPLGSKCRLAASCYSLGGAALGCSSSPTGLLSPLQAVWRPLPIKEICPRGK
jgi:hypothetical protein